MIVANPKVCLCAAVFLSLMLPGSAPGQTGTPTVVSMDETTKDACGTLVLSFGDRDDASLWLESFEPPRDINGNLRAVRSSVRGPEPTIDDLVTLFGHSPNRVFIGGHSDGKKLFNRREDVDALKISIEFQEDGVLLSRGQEQRFLAKGKEFLLHQNLEEVYWGGCNMHHDPEQVQVLARLFAKDDGTQPVMFGWATTSGWQVMHVILGGFGNEDPFPRLDYFDRLAQGEDPMTAWLTTINEAQWGTNSKVPASASVIDASGNEYVLSKAGEIVRSGRTFSAAASTELAETADTALATSD